MTNGTTATEGKPVVLDFTFPDGTTAKVQVPEKTFKTGRRGYYTAFVPAFNFNGRKYGGQIQLWEK